MKFDKLPDEIKKKSPKFEKFLLENAKKDYETLEEELKDITDKWNDEEMEYCYECGNSYIIYDDDGYKEACESIERQKSLILTPEWINDKISRQKEKEKRQSELKKEKSISKKKEIMQKRQNKKWKLNEIKILKEENEEIKRLTLLHGNKKRR